MRHNNSSAHYCTDPNHDLFLSTPTATSTHHPIPSHPTPGFPLTLAADMSSRSLDKTAAVSAAAAVARAASSRQQDKALSEDDLCEPASTACMSQICFSCAAICCWCSAWVSSRALIVLEARWNGKWNFVVRRYIDYIRIKAPERGAAGPAGALSLSPMYQLPSHDM